MNPLEDIAARVVAEARPGEQLEAYVARSVSTSVRAYKGEVESFSSARSEGIGVRVIVDHREGFAYAGALTDDDVAFALREARDNVAFSQPDDALGMASPDDAAGLEPVDLDLWRESLASVGPEAKIAMAVDLERATAKRDPRVQAVQYADYDDGMSEAAVANSLGLSAFSRGTGASLSVVALAEDAGDTRTGYGFSVGRHPDELDPEKVVSDAIERSTRLLGAVAIPSARMPIVLDPLVAKSFVGLLSTALSGEAVAKGRSFFAERVGEDVAAPIVTLTDDATDPRAYGATPVDDEGIPTRPLSLIEAGVLRGFAHNVTTARRVGNGARTTGSAARGYASPPGLGFHNLHLQPGTLTTDEILRRVGDGLYVQSVLGLHSGADPISGDLSAGAEGLMIRGGELAEPVRGVTVASTLQRLLLDIVAVSSDTEWLPSGLTAPVWVAEMTVSGT